MNIASLLLKKVLLEADSDTWVRIKKHYLPPEYQSLYQLINKYFEEYSKLPSFDSLKLYIRNDSILNKVYAIEVVKDAEISCSELLEYLKNEYTQEEIMDQISKYLDESIMMESASENLEKLQEIVTSVESKVDIQDPDEDMNRIELFDSEKDIQRSIPLGLNYEYDKEVLHGPGDYILIGGRRGAGKSVVCANIAVNIFEELEQSSLYFTIEMTSRATLQRMCSIATKVPAIKIKQKDLSIDEWKKVAHWWASRFEDGSEIYSEYLQHNSFDKFHSQLTKCNLIKDKQLDIVYDPSLTLAKIRSELDKKVEKIKPAVVIVDYINQVQRGVHQKNDQYDWKEQIEISKALKNIAQEYEVPVVSPYQIDASGEARLSKGILDSPDAAFVINPWTKEDACITLECSKMRNHPEIDSTSTMDWETLKIGPDKALNPKERKEKAQLESGEEEDVFDV